jgi:hypothetical protein
MQRFLFNTDSVGIRTRYICDCQMFVLHAECLDIMWHLQYINSFKCFDFVTAMQREHTQTHLILF